MWNNEKKTLFSFMSNLKAHCNFELYFQMWANIQEANG